MAPTSDSRAEKTARREAAREQARALREAQLRAEKRKRLVLIGVIVGGLTIVGVVVAVIVGIGGRSQVADVVSPAGANEAGGIVVGAAGIGEPNEGAPVVQVYSDFICPFCGLFETSNGPMLDELRAAGQVTVVYHPVAYLDEYSQGTDYSTRAAQAVAVVADQAPEQFVDFWNALFVAQPAENTPGLSDADIASIAVSAGVPQEVADTFTDGLFTPWVAAASDRATRDLPRPATPSIFVDGEQFSDDWRDPEALRAAILNAAG